ncbi:alkanesulfonate monooxygenase SsuD/methylene tetrahydromethanopterin reductase-like flavin-dependent oxidoreductase (luciferase family) [Microbacterium sp. SORGH_AS428]|uniref:LLM class flavin-dependent oxidoreductase n=1 Tax=Microbacterium sp. SORGH_AS_0428 TaxID=3041788 RepID=UPI002867354C|nr:LLM class flavin-dependent oxidoreductase [Microbacterium sp. SORGH_AS_0428]MDR6200968.1 alkanesulfonate monooxygenase SsuD/methylene tetrahydromethanopterin reductase-like flavin-dependent oxidoreductase (luciferase family) [Microbacterium sp. SORGH_AS_0428]
MVLRARLSLGLAGALGPDLIAALAPAAEEAGFATLWVNDTPTGDAVAALAAAAKRTHRIGLATGVVPLDRREPDSLVSALQAAEVPTDRLTVGIGSGSARTHQLALVERGIEALRAGVPGAQVVVGALGPRMRRLATSVADGQLLNWLTPDAAAAQREPDSRTILYVRTAFDAAALPRLLAEADTYAGYPAYAANFARLGFSARDTVITSLHDTARVSAYRAAVDEVVLRVIVERDDRGHYLDVIRSAATLIDADAS